MNAYLLILALSLAVAAMSMTITRAQLFAPVRDAVVDRSAFLGKLITCPYCASHWLAFAAVIVYRPRMGPQTWIAVDLVIAAFAIVTLAAFWSGLIYRAFQPMADADQHGESE